MKAKAKIGISLVVLAILALGAWKLDKDYGVFSGLIGGGGVRTNACYPLSVSLNANGSYIVPANVSCLNGAWVNASKPVGAVERYCDAYYMLITVNYTESGPVVTKQEAKGDGYCENGTLYEVPSTCGNYVCGANETAINCFADCGVVSDWAKMKQESANPELQPYIASTGVFSYNSQEIEELAEAVEATHPTTPLQAIKTLTRMISDRITYVPGGVAGNVQCGENSKTILDRGTGNCVDYSVVMIAVLRRGFDTDVGRVQIPARQVEGCLSKYGTWKMVEYNVEQTDLYDSRVKAPIIGHSWVSIYEGNGRWGSADPTMDNSLSRTTFGYHQIRMSDTSNQQLCVVSDDVEFCQYYAASEGD